MVWVTDTNPSGLLENPSYEVFRIDMFNLWTCCRIWYFYELQEYSFQENKIISKLFVNM